MKPGACQTKEQGSLQNSTPPPPPKKNADTMQKRIVPKPKHAREKPPDKEEEKGKKTMFESAGSPAESFYRPNSPKIQPIRASVRWAESMSCRGTGSRRPSTDFWNSWRHVVGAWSDLRDLRVRCVSKWGVSQTKPKEMRVWASLQTGFKTT